MQLFLIRHTKVEVTPGICYGQTDVNVASTFDEEKNIILKNIEGISFDRIFSSPMIRCKVLAQSISKNEQEIIFDKRLKELDFGLWEGKLWEEIAKTEKSIKWFDNYFIEKCPEGESYSDLINRVERFIKEIEKEQQTKNMAIICHGGTMRAFLSILNNVSPKATFQQEIGYGEIIKLRV